MSKDHQNEETKEKPRDPGVSGFTNLGNTCWLSSALQALVAVLIGIQMPPVPEPGPVDSNRDKSTDLVLAALRETLQGYGEKSVISPRKFLGVLKTHAGALGMPEFARPCVQHDASEFLGLVLDLMHQVGVRGFVVPERVVLDSHDGSQKQRVITAPAYGVWVPVSTGSVTKGLVTRFKEKVRVRVDDHDWVRKETLDISQARVLVVNVIRFTDSGERSSAPFAVERTLRFNDGGQMLTYGLVAAVYHIGSGADYGHYVSQVKKKGVWYLCDDHTIRRRPPPEKSTKITILVYRLKKKNKK